MLQIEQQYSGPSCLLSLFCFFLCPCMMFGTFNVRTAVVNGVNGIGHIDTLLIPCVAKGCDVIGLLETKRDGTSEIVASGYRVFFSGDCSGIKGRKGQHGVGMAIKEEIVKRAGEEGITTECINQRTSPESPNFD